METEIDVYAYSGLNTFVQHCSHEKIGIGGGDLNKVKTEAGEEAPEEYVNLYQVESIGFGIVINDDLARGSTSPCATFRNPDLMHNSGQLSTFVIANMEVWTLTPSWDENSAQRLEMVKYFADESVRMSTHTYTDDSSIHSSIISDVAGSFTSSDLIQEKFYRRVGEHDENESQRDRWQYANMMNLS
jgi:hypothetical protein